MDLAGIIVIFGSLCVGVMLRGRIARYARTKLHANLSGAEIAEKMLDSHGLGHVSITCIRGQLTDHYNPLTNTVNLSEQVYYGNNAAAAAIAAHECGHAVQHAQGYAFLKLRSAMVPVLSVTSRLLPWMITLGILLAHTTLIPLIAAIVFFVLIVLFSFITLPVEFDASHRALAWMENYRVVTSQEHQMAQDALWWAAMTYVVAALGSLVELMRLVRLLHRSRR